MLLPNLSRLVSRTLSRSLPLPLLSQYLSFFVRSLLLSHSQIACVVWSRSISGPRTGSTAHRSRAQLPGALVRCDTLGALGPSRCRHPISP